MGLESRYQEAMDLYNRGDTVAAEQRCHALLEEGRMAGVLYLLGLCQLRQDKAQEAINSLLEAVELVPDNPRFLHDLGRAYSSRGEWLAAARAYIRAIDLDPRVAENYLYLGPIYEQVGDMESAERAYRRALELDPQLATAAASLASLYEKANRLEEAEQLTAAALKQDSGNTVANLARAQLDYRQGAYADAALRLDRLLQKPLSPWNRAIAAGRLGAAYDKLERYPDAFRAFVAGKQALSAAGLSTIDTGMYSLQNAGLIHRSLDQLFADSGSAAGADAPVFLVGFPRSGTTLLDQILSSHSGIAVLEEKNLLQSTFQEFASSEAGVARLLSLDAAAGEQQRKQYWQFAEKALGQPLAGRVLVDKLPLYTAFMPVIHRIFPGARFIFAIRDPRDVVLSCFMHAFGLNEAMRHFLTLDSTAGYYAAVMDVGIRSLERLDGAAYRLSYETLVDDIEGSARRLCTFLGVEWQDELLRFYDTARKRRINTPSYHQVVQPVYRSSRERWRHYEQQLQPVLGRLQPYVEYFGYSR